MIRLFVKMYGLLIATLIVSFYIQTEVIDYFRAQAGPIKVTERFKGTFHLIEEVLKPLPPSAWETRFNELRKGFGAPAELYPLDALRSRFSLNEESQAYLADERIMVKDRPQGGFYLAKRIPASNQAVVLEFPGPKDMRSQIYAINWAVELFMVAILLWFWVRPFWRDLMALRGAAEEAGTGNLEVRVPERKGSPLYEFALCFNTMTARLSALMKSHKNLTNSVSHELRTPLARLRFSQHLAGEESTLAGKDRYLQLMERDIDELDELSTELLTYAKLEGGAPDIVLVKVQAAEWIDDLASNARRSAALQGKAISLTTQVLAADLVCEPRYLGRAVSNLLGNALRFASQTIAVTIRRDGTDFVIDVDDDGPGIAPGERERLFEPFARLDRSRDRATGGYGMGLAIVKQIAIWHGGGATIATSPLGGAKLTLRWPVRAFSDEPTSSHAPSQTATHSAAAAE